MTTQKREISKKQAAVLVAIHRHLWRYTSRPHAKDIRRDTGKSMGALVAMLHTLEGQGLVIHHHGQAQYSLTPEGQTAADLLDVGRHVVVSVTVAPYRGAASAKQLAVLMALLALEIEQGRKPHVMDLVARTGKSRSALVSMLATLARRGMALASDGFGRYETTEIGRDEVTRCGVTT